MMCAQRVETNKMEIRISRIYNLVIHLTCSALLRLYAASSEKLSNVRLQKSVELKVFEKLLYCGFCEAFFAFSEIKTCLEDSTLRITCVLRLKTQRIEKLFLSRRRFHVIRVQALKRLCN